MIDIQTETAFNKWLGAAGVEFFTDFVVEHGHIPLVIPTDGPIPHPIHFREGMQVRNWMRQNTEFEEDYVENNWREFVIECLGLTQRVSLD